MPSCDGLWLNRMKQSPALAGMQCLICFLRSVCKLISQWICSHKSTNLSTGPVKQRSMSSVEVSVLLPVLSWIFFKDNVNEWVTFACDGTGPADESKRTKRVQRWSRLNWLDGILIIVSWYIPLNKLLMPLTPVCCFVN